jgi:uncharacterized protein DUF973
MNSQSNVVTPGMPPSVPPTPNPISPDEVRGLRLARGGAVTALISLLLALLSPIAIILLSGIEVHYGGFHFGSGSFNNTIFEEILVVVSIGFLIAIVAVILYTLSFGAFRKVQSGFGGPRVLLILGVIGTFLIFVGVVLILSQFLMAVSCVKAGGSASCVSISSIVGAVLVIFLGLFLAFLGWIGLIIGLWRIGSRYHSTITKVGAILTIIPVVSIIAPILILIGVSESLRRLQSRAATP